MSGARLVWADVAKGGCIVLVVLWHVTTKDLLQLDWRVTEPLGVSVTGLWGTASQLLLPVRMPLFFTVSGLFAARWLERPWRQVVWGRVAPLAYLFVLWTLVQTLVLQWASGFDTAVAHDPRELLAGLTVTPGNLWYLLALATYVAVARATRGAPYAALVGAALLSVVAAAGWVATPGNRYGLLTNLVWFLLGTLAAGRPPVRAGLRRGAALAFVPAVLAWHALGADHWPGVRPSLDLLGVAAGATVATVLARTTRLGPALAALGQRTLPVYVLHLPLVALVHALAPAVEPHHSVLVAAVHPVLVTAAVVAVCLLLHRALLAVGAGWLFEAPWRRRTTPAGVPTVTHGGRAAGGGAT